MTTSLDNPLLVDDVWWDEIDADRKIVEGRKFGPTKNYPPGFHLTLIQPGTNKTIYRDVLKVVYYPSLRDYVTTELERAAPHIIRTSSDRNDAVEKTITAYNKIWPGYSGPMAAIYLTKITN